MLNGIERLRLWSGQIFKIYLKFPIFSWDYSIRTLREPNKSGNPTTLYFCDIIVPIMSTPEAIQAKADGAAAWSAGNFSQAAEHFTTAINLGGDKEFLKVLHSNRSAAYLKLNRITEALKDGNKCVELDNNWVKGYAREKVMHFWRPNSSPKPTMLTTLGLVSLLTTLQCKRRWSRPCVLFVMPAIKPVEHLLGHLLLSLESTFHPHRRRTSMFRLPRRPFWFWRCCIWFHSCRAVTVHWVTSKFIRVFSMRVVLLLQLAFHFTFSHITRLCIGTFAAVTVYNLYLKYGFPKFTTEFAQKLVPDPLSMDLFLSVVLLMNKPYLTSMSPVLIKAFATFTPRILNVSFCFLFFSFFTFFVHFEKYDTFHFSHTFLYCIIRSII